MPGSVDVSRKTVHEILQRFAEEQFAGLEDKSHARKKLRKVDIQTIQEIKKLSENPCLQGIEMVYCTSRE
jgi:transposase